MVEELISMATVEDYLGPGERRFFGAGYRRADQLLTELDLGTDEDGNGLVYGRAAVRYPADWSRKGRVDQLPHLSSVDVLLISGEIAETYLTHAMDLDPGQRAELKLRRVRLKAGNAPVEKELGGFAVRASVAPSAGGSRVRTQVGSLQAVLEVEHAGRVDRCVPVLVNSPDEVLGPGNARPFGSAHRRKRQRMSELTVDAAQRRASVLLEVGWEGTPGPVVGLESYSQWAISVVDVFVAAIQLGQILLYELDSMRRADSNTLWMRHTVLEVEERLRPTRGPAVLEAWLEDPRLLHRRDGTTWRAADILATCAGVKVRCSTTHQLPGSGNSGD